MIQAKGLKKQFGQLEILSDIDLHVAAGTSLAIIGASGEGKSTLLHILAGLEPPTAGSVLIDNEPVHARMRLHKLGFIFQGFHLLEELSAQENASFPAKIAGRKPPSDLLSLVGLQHRAQTSAKLLSGGEKQRVAIARALCNNPDVLFADEPSGNLDPTSAREIHALLIDLCKRLRKTLVIVTHNEELAQLLDRRVVLKGGKLHG